ncbi:MAG: NAD-dependent epimerase/dehydratase family protein [Bacteroidales bacterium]|jgi:nucleoside-diphosphate-sugar epimerase|nr:NAD-dependent epimerase/dehydratase family protein [Bacteroidales bacterium]
MKKVFVTGGSGFVGQYLITQLIKNDYEVIALARSVKTCEVIQLLGARPVMGDLSNNAAIIEGLQGCHSVFHLAATVDFSLTEKELRPLNVDATINILKLAQQQGIKNFVYLGAASVIMNGKPIYNADENFVSDKLTDGYSLTKLEAEKIVLAANNENFRTISLRPSLIWGKDEPHILPTIISAIQNNQLQFINGGKHKFVTCHVLNVCHALLLAEKTSKGGEAYFITDGKPLVFKWFVEKYVGTQGVSVPDKEVSLRMAKIFAGFMEFIWKFFSLSGQPPLNKATVKATGMEFTVTDQKAREEIGYSNIISVEEGFAEMINSQ